MPYFILYVDDACIISHSKLTMHVEIKSLQLEYDLTDDGELQDYLGIQIERSDDGSITLIQPRMINRVIDIEGLTSDTHVKTHDIPTTHISNSDSTAQPRIQTWNYRLTVGCVSYLQAMVRPDITFYVQQGARFCNNSTKEHEEAVKHICCYILKTKSRGLVLKPDICKGLECYVDAEWAGSWFKLSSHDPLSTRSRT